MDVDADLARSWLARFAASVREQEEVLTELDSAIGDADHALNMLRGLDAAQEAAADEPSPGPALRKAGRAFVSYAGGATGPLWGTFFMRMGDALGQAPTGDPTALAAALREGVTGLAARGRTKAGDGTMLDALLPAVVALEHDPGAWSAAAAAAAAGRDSTGALVPRRGRAGYLGDRAVGHVDPGAASAALLIAALVDVMTNGSSLVTADSLSSSRQTGVGDTQVGKEATDTTATGARTGRPPTDGPPPLPAASPSSREAAVTDVVPAQLREPFDRWQSGIAAFDLDQIASAFTRDVLFQGLGPDYTLGRGGIRDYYYRAGAGLSVAYQIRESATLGSDAVLIYATADFIHPDGAVTRTHLTAVLQRLADQWLISHYHVSRIE